MFDRFRTAGLIRKKLFQESGWLSMDPPCCNGLIRIEMSSYCFSLSFIAITMRKCRNSVTAILGVYGVHSTTPGIQAYF